MAWPYSASKLSRTLEILVLCVVAATALAYPLCLGDDALERLSAAFAGRWFTRQVLPALSCGYSPLVLKEAILLTLGGFVLFVFAWIKLRRQWLGAEGSALRGMNGWRDWLVCPEVWAIALLLFAAASVGWSEVFQQSLQTWLLFAAGVALALVVRSEVNARQMAPRFMGLVIACGAVLAALALMQHLGAADSFLPVSRDPRNRMSSLIGHNTGLSAWLLFPLAYCLYFLATARGWRRILPAALAALFALVIMAAQSRAVWVLGLGLVTWLPLKMARARGRRVRLTSILAAVAAGLVLVGLLTINPQNNLLARLPVSLGQRVEKDVFNLDQLRRETRLRILVISATKLVPAAPLLGTGIGSFSWEYPQAQGDYFADHPQSWLGTTTKRTDLAHNDYLQLLTETGLVGLLLLAGLVWSLVIELRQVMRRLDGGSRALCWALAAPSAAIALQALVDFPFHVAPVAVLSITSLALASRLDRTATAAADIATPPPIAQRRATAIGLVAAVVMFAWLPWALSAVVGAALISDVYYNLGLKWLQEYQSQQNWPVLRQIGALDRARSAFREAVVSNVFNGEAYEGQATAYVNRAGVALDTLVKTPPEDRQSTLSQALRSVVDRDTESAIAVTENQLHSGGLRYHYTWYLLGRAWRLKWELARLESAPADREQKYLAEAVAALEKALHYNPADAASIRELSDMYLASPATAEKGRELRNRLFKVDPYSADELLLQPALKQAEAGEIETAREMLADVMEKLPNEQRVMAARAWLAFYEAVWPPAALDAVDRKLEYRAWRQQHLERGWDAVKKMPTTGPLAPQRRRLELLYAAAAHDLHRANELAGARTKADPGDWEAWSIYYWTQQELHGGGLKQKDNLAYYRIRGLYALEFMEDPEAGLALAELATRTGLPAEKQITLAEARRVTSFCLANSMWSFLPNFIPQLVKRFPTDSVISKAATLMERHSAD